MLVDNDFLGLASLGAWETSSTTTTPHPLTVLTGAAAQAELARRTTHPFQVRPGDPPPPVESAAIAATNWALATSTRKAEAAAAQAAATGKNAVTGAVNTAVDLGSGMSSAVKLLLVVGIGAPLAYFGYKYLSKPSTATNPRYRRRRR